MNMFIDWVKDIGGEWWEQEGGLVVAIWSVWSIASFVFCGAFLFTGGTWNDWAAPFMPYVIPVMAITGVLPAFIWAGWKVGTRLYYLYEDYQYFAANGGKRKRGDS